MCFDFEVMELEGVAQTLQTSYCLYNVSSPSGIGKKTFIFEAIETHEI